MSDFVDPFATSSEGGTPDAVLSGPAEGGASGPPSEKPGKLITTPAEVPQIVQDVLAERGSSTPSVVDSSPLPRPNPRPRSAKNQRGKKVVERGDGKCTAYAQVGTKCKLCGKVHPL